MHPMTGVMGCFSHLFFTCSSPESRCKWKGKPAMHQMVHMKWYEPQGGLVLAENWQSDWLLAWVLLQLAAFGS